MFPETTRATFALATFPVRFDALMFEIPNPFEAVKSPFTVRPVRVPTLVIFVWAAPETTRATFELATFPVRFDALIFERPYAFPVCAPAESVPLTVRLVRVPTLVIFGCAAFVTVPAVAMVPTIFEALMFEIAEPFEMVT